MERTAVDVARLHLIGWLVTVHSQQNETSPHWWNDPAVVDWRMAHHQTSHCWTLNSRDVAGNWHAITSLRQSLVIRTVRVVVTDICPFWTCDNVTRLPDYHPMSNLIASNRQTYPYSIRFIQFIHTFTIVKYGQPRPQPAGSVDPNQRLKPRHGAAIQQNSNTDDTHITGT
jgi:hypothetical protein